MPESLLLYGSGGKVLLANAAAREVWLGCGLTPPDNHHDMLEGIEWMRSK